MFAIKEDTISLSRDQEARRVAGKIYRARCLPAACISLPAHEPPSLGNNQEIWPNYRNSVLALPMQFSSFRQDFLQRILHVVVTSKVDPCVTLRIG